jgi:hypothetical protein
MVAPILFSNRNSSAFGFLLQASSHANIAKPNKVRHAIFAWLDASQPLRVLTDFAA